MTHQIRRHDDANHAITVDGTWISRSREMYLPSHKRAYPCLPTSLHFVFREPNMEGRRGSTIYCTCGSTAAVFDRTAYRRWTETNYGEVIACLHLIQNGVHADGAHE